MTVYAIQLTIWLLSGVTINATSENTFDTEALCNEEAAKAQVHFEKQFGAKASKIRTHCFPVIKGPEDAKPV